MPPEDLLPVLVADLADDEAHEILEAAAFAGSRIVVPLDTAPVNASQHVLEVHLPTMAEPLYYLAWPLGPPTEEGFPLRISPMPDAAPSATAAAAPASAVMRSRRATTSVALSASHTADLSHVGPLPTGPDDGLLGRALAGGKLLIESLIGRGGVGAVYKARHRELRMPVAVKVLHESFQHDIDFCRRFYAEALAASRLDHPNITRVIDFGQEPDGLLYLAMEFLAGVELRAVMDASRTLPAQRIAELMMQTCAGLSHAHARDIVHRDIKPENLVLVPASDDDGQPIELVKVCDFGIAQHRALPSTEEEGVIAGTPEYMSPEQCRGDSLDARSDVYACGVVLYELATGQVPFTAERPQSILNKHQFTAPVAPSLLRSDVDPRLERIILRALEKEPEDRPQSMRELRAELRELLAPAAEASPRPPPSQRNPPPSTPDLGTPRPARPAQSAPASPPPLPERAKAAPAPSAPAWLERGPVYAPGGYSAPEPNVPAQPPASAAVGMDEVAGALVANPSAWLRGFSHTTEPRAFAQLAQKLEPALRTLAHAGEMKALWAVSSTLNGISMEGTQASGSRARAAGALLRVFADPAILSLVAEHLLTGNDETRDHARRILVHAGVAGAYGLYGARVKLASTQAIRGPFITVLKDFGPKAWPVVRAALEKIAASEGSLNAPTLELAEDLLLSVPFVGDESAGHLVVKYLRVNVSGVCRAATAAIVKLWADRAKPLLVGMLQSKDDVVRIAGIAGLRQLGGIDEHVVPRLHAILTKRLPAGEELRAAAALSLSHAVPSAVPPAVSLLAQLLTPLRDNPEVRTGAAAGQLTREDAVVIAIARSLLTIGGKGYRGLVAERAERSPEPLRTQLKKQLAS
ncbi:MAG: serine/threonine protein kinase [Labilithrix sp.]|nr:serine/threonine protein kinase [Labilithrix sp.]